jgi:hypothetical protein
LPDLELKVKPVRKLAAPRYSAVVAGTITSRCQVSLVALLDARQMASRSLPIKSWCGENASRQVSSRNSAQRRSGAKRHLVHQRWAVAASEVTIMVSLPAAFLRCPRRASSSIGRTNGLGQV